MTAQTTMPASGPASSEEQLTTTSTPEATSSEDGATTASTPDATPPEEVATTTADTDVASSEEENKVLPVPDESTSEDERTRYVAALIDGMEGWCTPLKGRVLYDLARAPGCELAVEIGIFGGKSLVPVARGFADKGSGRIYGVEPWDNAVAVETVTNEGNDQWWLEVDLLGIKRSFLRRISDLGLEKQVKILEVPSDSALLIFQTARFAGKIDLVHVDGAHSVEQSTLDCAYWLRLLKPGGHLVLDDIDWGTVDPAHRFLEQAADRVFISESAENGYFVVFRKRGGPQP